MNANAQNVRPAAVPAVIPAGSDVIKVMGGEIHFGAVGAHTGNGCVQWLGVAPAGCFVPMHVHDHEDELFLVLEGALRVEIEGQAPIIATPGMSVFGPRGLAHAWYTHGEQTCRMLITALPGGMEAMLRELSKLPDGPPNPEVIGEICGRYGIRFV